MKFIGNSCRFRYRARQKFRGLVSLLLGQVLLVIYVLLFRASHVASTNNKKLQQSTNVEKFLLTISFLHFRRDE
jgi:hypothetical protein